MRHTFTAEQWLPYPVELAFAFFANPENLPFLMPEWQKARIEVIAYAPPPPRPADQSLRFSGNVAGAGTTMTISFRPFPYAPIRIPWDAEIDEFAWNDHFCDTQSRGPFAYWKHCHSLNAEIREDKPGTRLTDRVEYEMHLGPIGELAHKLAARRQIESIFAYRHKRTAELLPRLSRAAGLG